MPRGGFKVEDACWKEVERVNTGQRHPNVHCRHCNTDWTSNERMKVIHHLRVCKGLPESLWEKYQPSRIETGEVPKRTKGKSPLLTAGIDLIGPGEHSAAIDACAKWIYSSGLPLSAVDHPAFHAFIKQLRPGFTPPTRHQLSSTILDRHYKDLQKEVSEAISKASHVTVVTDGWSNPRGEAIVNHLAVTPQAAYFYRSIDTKIERHTGRYLATDLASVISELGGQPKVVAVTTDNASNMKAAQEVLAKEYPGIITLGCSSHHLNLLINDIFKLPAVKAIWDEVKDVAKYFKNHAIALAFVKGWSKGTFTAIQLPGKTRWQGKLLCVASLINNQASLTQATYDEDSILPAKPKKDDNEAWQPVKSSLANPSFWQQARSLHQLLEPFLKVTIGLESTQPRLSHIYADMTWLSRQQINSLLVPAVVLQTLISQRFAKIYHPLITIAFLADPIERQRRPEIIVQESQFTNLSSFLMQYCKGNKDRAIKLYAKLAQLRALSGPFNNEMNWGAAKSMDPISWWQSFYLQSEPDLSELCVLALAITPTTGAAERSWSAHGFIHNLKRNALSHDIVEKLVYLFWNLKIKHYWHGFEAEEDEPEPFEEQAQFEPDFGYEPLEMDIDPLLDDL